LRMGRLIFTKVHVEVNQHADLSRSAEEFEFNGHPVVTEIAAGIKKGQEDFPVDFLVKVRITILHENDNTNPAPYDIDVEAQALFSLDPDFPPQTEAETKQERIAKRDELVRINGGSIIIGAIREIVTQIT